MNPPKRLLDSAQTDALTRKLLGSARPVEPPPGASREVWLALSSQLPALPPPPPAAVPDPAALAASSQGIWAVFIKPALLGAVLAGSAVGVHSVATAPRPAVTAAATAGATATATATAGVGAAATATAGATATATAAATATAGAAAAATATAAAAQAAEPAAAVAEPTRPALAGSGEAAPVASVTGDAPALSPSAERIKQMVAEAETVRKARAMVSSGDGAGALRLLAQMPPSGALSQEREVIAIEALAVSGQRAAAAERARAFLSTFPNSPHAALLRSFVP